MTAIPTNRPDFPDHRDFPLYLAPMAGVTDTLFRQFCKQQGADVMVTEFVSAEGIFHRNRRTSEFLEFSESERPLGVQLFGADAGNMGDAAQQVIDWVRPDFIDINFGCPVNKVVSKNGGSALLKDCPLLAKVASTVAKAVAPFPVTAKIRIGWNASMVNAVEVARILEDCGMQRIAVHGRTKDQGYSGEADWEVIDQVARAVSVPVIGNGDIQGAADVEKRRRETAVSGVMIGRAAMSSPWIFHEIRTYLETGEVPEPPRLEERWTWIRRHCELAVERRGSETAAMHSMRSRLMAYTRGLPGSRQLRLAFSKVETLEGLDAIADAHLDENPEHRVPSAELSV